MKRETIQIESVRLVRLGNFAAVYVTVNGQEVEVIREVYDNAFCHNVSASGILARLEKR